MRSMSFVTGGARALMPATGISWFEAAQFTNYLNTSQGFQAAYKFDGLGTFELWEVGDPSFDAANPYRNSLANYVLPSVDERYKAAFYDPTSGSYFNYATGSDTAPTAVASGTDPRTAVYSQSFSAFAAAGGARF